MSQDRYIIYKYELDMMSRVTVLNLPEPHRVLHVGSIQGRLCLWILHSYDVQGSKDRVFHVIGTGRGIDQDDLESFTFIGSTVVDLIVCHVFAAWRSWDRR